MSKIGKSEGRQVQITAPEGGCFEDVPLFVGRSWLIPVRDAEADEIVDCYIGAMNVTLPVADDQTFTDQASVWYDVDNDNCVDADNGTEALGTYCGVDDHDATRIVVRLYETHRGLADVEGMSLISDPVAGNVASMDANGQATDGGVAVADLATSASIKQRENVLRFWNPGSGTPVEPDDGDRYIANGSANGWSDAMIYEWATDEWVETQPNPGDICEAENGDGGSPAIDEGLYRYSAGSIWERLLDGGAHIQNALDNANDPATSNPFATMDDLDGLGNVSVGSVAMAQLTVDAEFDADETVSIGADTFIAKVSPAAAPAKEFAISDSIAHTLDNLAACINARGTEDVVATGPTVTGVGTMWVRTADGPGGSPVAGTPASTALSSTNGDATWERANLNQSGTDASTGIAHGVSVVTAAQAALLASDSAYSLAALPFVQKTNSVLMVHVTDADGVPKIVTDKIFSADAAGATVILINGDGATNCLEGWKINWTFIR